MGLIGGMARTAVIAGTATAVSNNVSRRQAQRWQQQEYEQAAPPPPPAPVPPPSPGSAGGSALTGEIERLSDLRRQGMLTDEEFAAAKAKLLGL